MSSSTVLALGGGGDFAIYLDESIRTGTSGPCGTFSSPSLIDSADPFTCVECELYLLESTIQTCNSLHIDHSTKPQLSSDHSVLGSDTYAGKDYNFSHDVHTPRHLPSIVSGEESPSADYDIVEIPSAALTSQDENPQIQSHIVDSSNQESSQKSKSLSSSNADLLEFENYLSSLTDSSEASRLNNNYDSDSRIDFDEALDLL